MRRKSSETMRHLKNLAHVGTNQKNVLALTLDLGLNLGFGVSAAKRTGAPAPVRPV